MFSQEYQLIEKSSSIDANGTSSLHDWKVEVEEFNGNLILDENSSQVVNLRITINSKSLVGDRKVMNKKIYKALKTNEVEVIEFVSGDSQIVEYINTNERKLKIKGKQKTY